jgi:hypothetical protein
MDRSPSVTPIGGMSGRCQAVEVASAPLRVKRVDRLAAIGDLEVDSNGLGKRSGEGGDHHRCERGNEAGADESAESVGVAGLARCRACGDPGVIHAVHGVPPSLK